MSVDAAVRIGLFARSSDHVLAALEVDLETGLSSREARSRRKIYGKNQLRRQKRKSILSLLADQFRSVIVWLLCAAAVLSFFNGDIAEGIAIVCVLAINAGIGFYTNLKAIRSMETLFRMTATLARVRRDGQSRMLPVQALTPGDIVVLEGGDIVPADLRILQAAHLTCDESMLTGESVPVEKAVDVLQPDTLVADRINMAFKGTAVTQGTGVGVVAAIGPETELGQISTLAQSAEAEVNPLEKRLDKLGEALVWITVGLSAMIALAGYLRGLELVDMVETAIALAVAAVPEGLPVVATLALARGMLRLARRNALIERLSAVETLGATTIILTDKTGTLTANRMTVTGFLLDGRDVDASDWGKQAAVDDPVLRRALEIGALCNTAELSGPQRGDQPSGVGDPMELALLHIADAFGVRPDLDPDARPEIEIYPYDPETKMMATRHAVKDGVLTAAKGAPETVLHNARRILTQDGIRALTQEARADWLRRIETSANQGHRLIGVACKTSKTADDPPFQSLVLVGFVALLDPLRDDVPAAIAESQRAGVRVVMMTGDHIATATEIAKQAGLATNGDIVAVSEDELRQIEPGNLSDDLKEHLSNANVFARVSPETKLKLVQFFQHAGHVVAMTGDGVNDAPALKKADIGIAMGQRGTQVARDAADMVLKDDAFASIIAAMRQGRIIFGNIRRFVIYLMSCNFSEILVVGLAIAAGLPAPLIPLQILFLNIVTDVFPAFALGLSEGDQNVMKRPPRDPEEPIVGREQWIDIVVFGVLVTLATLGAFWVALVPMSLSPVEAATIAFLTLALAQLWHVFNMRAYDERGMVNSVTRNAFVWAALAFCIGLLAVVFLVPALSKVMGLMPLDATHLALSLGASVVPLITGQIWLTRRRAAGPSAPTRKAA